jgi:hypothetical protein
LLGLFIFFVYVENKPPFCTASTITGTKLLIGLALIMNRGAFKFKKVLTVLGGVYTGEGAVHIAAITSKGDWIRFEKF